MKKNEVVAYITVISYWLLGAILGYLYQSDVFCGLAIAIVWTHVVGWWRAYMMGAPR
jgi:hypothetical protein